MQVLLLPELAKVAIQSEDDLLVRTTLEGDALALVVETETEEQRDFDSRSLRSTSRASFDDPADDGTCVESRRLTLRKKSGKNKMSFVFCGRSKTKRRARRSLT